MRSKLNYLISVSLNRKIKTKWFLTANIILAIVLLEFLILTVSLVFLVAILMKKPKFM